MTRQQMSVKKWEPSASTQKTPTQNSNNQHKLTAIQRPSLHADYQGHLTRPPADKDHVIIEPQSPRINPDSIKTLWFTVGLIIILGVTSFLVSFNGLLDVAAWVGLPEVLRWTVPAFIDVSILAYSMAAVIHKARNEKVAATWASLGVFTLISVVANAVHAMSKGEGSTTTQVIIGATIAAAAPIAVFAATEELSRLAFRVPKTFEAPDIEAEVVPDVPVVASLSERVQLTAVESLPSEKSEDEAADPQKTDSIAKAAEVASAVVEGHEASKEEETSVVEEKKVEKAIPADETETPLDDDLEVLAQWVQEQAEQGVKVTGAMVAEAIGKSPRTGNNRLNQLKDTRPELFDEEA